MPYRILDHFSYNFDNFLPLKVKREVKELYISLAIKYLAVGMIGLFEPVYLYFLGLSLWQIAFYFAACHTLYFFILPLGGKLISRFGFEHCTLFSILLFILYFFVLYLIPYFFLLIFIAPLILAIYKAIFWPAYHANFAFYSQIQEIGKEIALARSISLITQIIGPFFGGMILALFGFKVLLVTVSLLLLTSTIPLFTTLEKFNPRKFSYRKAFSRLFSKKHKKRLIGYLGFGEELIAEYFWPIFLWLVLKNYFSMGFLTTLATIISSLIVLYIGRISDKIRKRNLLRFGEIFYFLGWLIRGFIRDPLSVFMIILYNRTSWSIIDIPLISTLYNRAQKEGVLDQIIFFCQANVLAKSLVCWFLVLFFLFTSNFFLIFLLAGLISLLYFFVPRSK